MPAPQHQHPQSNSSSPPVITNPIRGSRSVNKTKNSICHRLALCKACWRPVSLKAAFQCANCMCAMHLKCDTSDVNLIRPNQGLLIDMENLPKTKKHYNWCHLCQRIENKLNHLIVDQMTFCGSKTILKHVLITMISFLRTTNPLFTSKHIVNVLSTINECVLDDQVHIIEQFLSILYQLIEAELLRIFESTNSPAVIDLEGINKNLNNYSTSMIPSANQTSMMNHLKSSDKISNEFEEALGHFRIFLRSVRKELSDIENCPSCYQMTKSDSSKQDFSKICEFPHYIVWIKIGSNSLLKPAKLIWINSSHAFIQQFDNHKFTVIDLDNIYEFSEYYQAESETKWSFHVFNDNLYDILAKYYHEIPSAIHKAQDELSLAFQSLKLYISKIREKMTNRSKDIMSSPEKIQVLKYARPLHPLRWMNYSPFNLVHSKHIQFPSFKINHNTSLDLIDLKTYQIRSVETFSLRCKIDIIKSNKDLSILRPKPSSNSNNTIKTQQDDKKARTSLLSASMFANHFNSPNSKEIELNDSTKNYITKDDNRLKQQNITVSAQGMSRISSHPSSKQSNSQISNNSHATLSRNRRKVKKIDSSKIASNNEQSRSKVLKKASLSQIGQRIVSNIGPGLMLPNISHYLANDHPNHIRKIEIPEDLIPTADLISTLHQHLMNAISEQVGSFCFTIMKVLNNLPGNETINISNTLIDSLSKQPKSTQIKGLDLKLTKSTNLDVNCMPFDDNTLLLSSSPSSSPVNGTINNNQNNTMNNNVENNNNEEDEDEDSSQEYGDIDEVSIDHISSNSFHKEQN